jgi:hypothetical protein
MEKMWSTRALQRAAAPLGSRTVRKNLIATLEPDRAVPAAVVEKTLSDFTS